MIETIPENLTLSPMRLEKLNILSWNVRLLKFGDIDAFLNRMSDTFADWEVLLLQEFYSGANVFPTFSQEGHRTLATLPHRGSRRMGIVVRKRTDKFIFTKFVWAPSESS